MNNDEFEESLDFDEADTLMIRRMGRTRRHPVTKPTIRTDRRFNPWARWTKAQRDEFNRRKAARAKEIAAQVEPTNGKCPKGYHLGWALRHILLPGMVGMPAPRKVCQPDKPGTTPTPIYRPPKEDMPGSAQCGTRSEGRGITWGRILPQYRYLSRAKRQAIVDKMCGRKQKPPIPDDAALKKLTEQYNAAKSKYELLVTEGRTINDQYRRKKAEIAKARRVLADAERRLRGTPHRIRLPDRWKLYRRRR